MTKYGFKFAMKNADSGAIDGVLSSLEKFLNRYGYKLLPIENRRPKKASIYVEAEDDRQTVKKYIKQSIKIYTDGWSKHRSENSLIDIIEKEQPHKPSNLENAADEETLLYVQILEDNNRELSRVNSALTKENKRLNNAGTVKKSARQYQLDDKKLDDLVRQFESKNNSLTDEQKNELVDYLLTRNLRLENQDQERLTELNANNSVYGQNMAKIHSLEATVRRHDAEKKLLKSEQSKKTDAMARGFETKMRSYGSRLLRILATADQNLVQELKALHSDVIEDSKSIRYIEPTKTSADYILEAVSEQKRSPKEVFEYLQTHYKDQDILAQTSIMPTMAQMVKDGQLVKLKHATYGLPGETLDDVLTKTPTNVYTAPKGKVRSQEKRPVSETVEESVLTSSYFIVEAVRKGNRSPQEVYTYLKDVAYKGKDMPLAQGSVAPAMAKLYNAGVLIKPAYGKYAIPGETLDDVVSKPIVAEQYVSKGKVRSQDLVRDAVNKGITDADKITQYVRTHGGRAKDKNSVYTYLSVLANEGAIKRVSKGVYEPIPQH